MFSKAIVRRPCKNIIIGITSTDLGKPDYQLAKKQHTEYINALISCGLEVIILNENDRFPDSTFVEDTALLTPKCAIIMSPGEQSRAGETASIKELLPSFYSNIEEIKSPGTIEGGDIMMVGDHYYIGLSERTNKQGADQMIEILNKYGYTASTVMLKKFLHLKTGLAYLENNNLLITGEFFNNPAFNNFNKIIVREEEAYTANCIWVNDTVLIPEGFPKTKAKIEDVGYKTISINVSEFRKLDGGLSCLSLRF